MRAVVYKKPFIVAVEERPKPELTHPDDIIVRSACFILDIKTETRADSSSA